MSKFEKLYDRVNAERWAHPELPSYEVYTALPMTTLDVYYDFDTPLEERRAAAHKYVADTKKMILDADPQSPAYTRSEHYTTDHGCPEEPETTVEVVLYRPLNYKEGEKLNVLYVCPGGALYAAMIEEMGNLHPLADELHCAVVCARYRSALDAPWPAAINDLHAGYEYITEHADELGLNTEKIVLFGASTGSHLSASLAFRLKRYGHHPRGCVGALCFLDHRAIYATSHIKSGGSWDATTANRSAMQWLGFKGNFADLGPEFFPAYATAEDCIGLCPMFLHPEAEEANSQSVFKFAESLATAGVYYEIHDWGGACHGVTFATISQERTDYERRYFDVLYGNIRDCWKYDLRRLWIEKELAE
jgi:acetyl esterase/lipase